VFAQIYGDWQDRAVMEVFHNFGIPLLYRIKIREPLLYPFFVQIGARIYDHFFIY